MYNQENYIFKEGPIGKEGPPGKPGKNGLNGDKGDKGDRGERGYPGIGEKGEQGEKGDTGDNGEKGDIGPANGPTGDTGPTGPSGLNGDHGLVGPTGAAGKDIIHISYDDIAIYSVKLMKEYYKVSTNTKLYMANSNVFENINIGVLYCKYLSNNTKYITNILVSKTQFNLSFNITTSHPVKYIFMTSIGQALSVPISLSQVDMITEYNMIIKFDFDSQVAYAEYVFQGAVYDIHINWFQ
jgi:hypothetical protein